MCLAICEDEAKMKKEEAHGLPSELLFRKFAVFTVTEKTPPKPTAMSGAAASSLHIQAYN